MKNKLDDMKLLPIYGFIFSIFLAFLLSGCGSNDAKLKESMLSAVKDSFYDYLNFQGLQAYNIDIRYDLADADDGFFTAQIDFNIPENYSETFTRETLKIKCSGGPDVWGCPLGHDYWFTDNVFDWTTLCKGIGRDEYCD